MNRYPHVDDHSVAYQRYRRAPCSLLFRTSFGNCRLLTVWVRRMNLVAQVRSESETPVRGCCPRAGRDGASAIQQAKELRVCVHGATVILYLTRVWCV